MIEITGIGWAPALTAFAVGVVGSVAGGAIGGALMAHGHMDKSLGAWMGAFYGPLAGIPGLVAGLILLALAQAGGAS